MALSKKRSRSAEPSLLALSLERKQLKFSLVKVREDILLQWLPNCKAVVKVILLYAGPLEVFTTSSRAQCWNNKCITFLSVPLFSMDGIKLMELSFTIPRGVETFWSGIDQQYVDGKARIFPYINVNQCQAFLVENFMFVFLSENR